MAISRMRRYAKVIAFLAILRLAYQDAGEKEAQQNYHFLEHGTLKRWRSFQKCIQEQPKMEWRKRIYMNSEDFVGYELEYTADYFRIGENTYTDPEYGLFFEDIFTVNDGGRFWPHVCDFMEEEGIDWHDDNTTVKETAWNCIYGFI